MENSSPLSRAREEAARLKKEVRKKTIGYISAGLGLVAGLAWNEAIKDLINVLFPLEENSVIAKFIYAIVMTLVVVVMTLYLIKKEKKKE